MTRKRWVVLVGIVALGALSLFGQAVYSREGGISLGGGKRKAMKVEYQRVVFPHRRHQEMVLKLTGNDKEKACSICHHKKRKGKDPRACRRCHGRRQTKAKGVDNCQGKCHVKAILEGVPGKRARKGQLLKLKDAFHIRCKNCHARMRGLLIDLDATKYMAPILECEGCHVPVSEADRKEVEEMKKKERKMIGDTMELLKEAVAEFKQ